MSAAVAVVHAGGVHSTVAGAHENRRSGAVAVGGSRRSEIELARPHVSMQVVEVRDAAPEDAAALAYVHAETWIGTYVGNVADGLAAERVARARDRDWKKHAELRNELGGGTL